MKTVGSIINTPFDDLSERIQIVYFSTERNECGDIISISEIERCRIWAKVFPLNARRNEVLPEEVNKISYRVTIRYRTDILPDDEINWRGRRLKMTAPPYDAESRKIYIVLDCEEVTSDGS